MLVTDTQKERLVQTGKSFILPEQVEEEAHIIHIDFYKAPKSKLIVFAIFTLLTAGFLALLAKWKDSIRIFLMYVKANPSEAENLSIKGLDGTRELISVKLRELNLDGTKKIYRTFEYRLYTFYFDIVDGLYRPIQFTIKNQTYEDLHKKRGNTFEEYEKNMLNYGENSTNVPRKSDFEILVDEVLSPFYMFQLFAVVFWGFVIDYAIYAGFIFVISAVTLTLGFFKIKSNHRKLQQKAFYETEVKIFSLFTQNGDRNKPEQRIISSNFLVPGDLIEIPNNKKLPCDIILLNGTCVVNESMLTGESVPVIKQQLPRIDKIFDATSADQYILFSGTECLETRNIDPKAPVVGMVFRTGFATMKGRLVRSFIYSKPENFKFYRDSLKYIGAMGCVAMLCFAFTIKALIDQGEEAGAIIRRSLDIITIAVPPALPTCVAIGASIASARLEKKKILTKSEIKINVAGKVQFMCFDKTGTLTRDSLDLHGVRGMTRSEANSTNQFQSLISNNIHRGLNYSPNKNLSHKLLELMATCHSLTFVRNTLTGDPLDMKMFEAAGWRLTESNASSASNSQAEARLCTLNPPVDEEAGYYTPTSQVYVIKRFEFSPKLQRMSVITKDQREKMQRVYVKGSPEMIATLCKPETLPEDYSKILLSYTHSGLRVIACATKTIEEKVTVNDELDRESYEKDLEFLGFLIFENKMKEITPTIINKLKIADINTIMLTGDNPLTAIFVARGCGIVEQGQKVILGTLNSTENSKEIEWQVIQGLKIEPNLSTEADSPTKTSLSNQVAIEMSERSVASLVSHHEEKVKEIEEVNYNETVPQKQLFSMLESDSNLAIAMTGEAFNFFDSSAENDITLRQAVLKKAKVLARMRPDDKAFVVDKLQNQGYIVGMCGDGANDCPALKVANVGVSLSESEASLAAPFMSKITDISCIDILLREGRTALVTSFQCFKFMSMYSLIQTVTVVLLYARATAMTDASFLYQDLIVIIPAAFTMALTLPTSKLSKQQPTGSLLSFTVLTSMLGQCVIQAAAQYLALVFLQGASWYKSPTELYDEAVAETGDEDVFVADYDNTMLFHVGNLQYLATVLAFSIGKPFRKPFYTNIYFTLSVGLISVLSILIILVDIPFLMDFLQLRNFEGNEGFRVEIVVFIAINTAITLAYEKFVVPAFVHVGKKLTQKQKAKSS